MMREEEISRKKQLVVMLDANLHKEFSACVAYQALTQRNVVSKMIADYCRIHPVHTAIKDDDDRKRNKQKETARLKALNTKIERIPPDQLKVRKIFTYRELYRYLCKNAERHGLIKEDIEWIGEDRLHRMLNQKTGTGRAYSAIGEGRFSLKRPENRNMS